MFFGYPPEVLTRSLAWSTDVLKAYDGSEKRHSMAPYPRELFTARYALDENALRQLRILLQLFPATVHEIPLTDESIGVSAFSGTSATVDRTYLDWCAASQRVLVYEPINDDTVTAYPGKYYSQLATIITAPAGPGSVSLTLDLNLTSSGFRFPRIAPLVGVIFDDGQNLGKHPVNEGIFEMRGRRTTVQTTWGTGGGTLTTFDGFNVMDRFPWAREIAQEQVMSGVMITDYGGSVSAMWARTIADVRRSHMFVFHNDAGRQWWRKFLIAIKGRQKAFLLPTYRNDLQPMSDPAGTTVAVSQWATPSGPYSPAQELFAAGREHLAFFFSDGSVAYRKIASIVDDAPEDTITLTASLSTPGGATCTSISWLEICRLESDSVTITPADPAITATGGVVKLDAIVVQR